MSLARFARKFTLLLLGAGALAAGSPAFGGPLGCFGCCHEKCPPCFVHCFEGPPRIKFKRGCPRPVCNPCNLPHFGYYQTCWQPWPFPPDWSHCPVPPPGLMVGPCPCHGLPAVPPGARAPAAAPGNGTGTPLTPPRKAENTGTVKPLAFDSPLAH